MSVVVEWFISSFEWSVNEINGKHIRKGLLKLFNPLFLIVALIWVISIAFALGGLHYECGG